MSKCVRCMKGSPRKKSMHQGVPQKKSMHQGVLPKKVDAPRGPPQNDRCTKGSPQKKVDALCLGQCIENSDPDILR